MWVIIDYKSQFETEMTASKKRWGNNPRLQCLVAAPLLTSRTDTASQPCTRKHKNSYFTCKPGSALTSNIHPKRLLEEHLIANHSKNMDSSNTEARLKWRFINHPDTRQPILSGTASNRHRIFYQFKIGGTIIVKIQNWRNNNSKPKHRWWL